MRLALTEYRPDGTVRSSLRHGLCLTAMLILTLWAMAARACEIPEDYLTDIRPVAAEGPTIVSLGFGVADVLGVDDLNQQIELDFYVRMSWFDPRLTELVGCRFPVTATWFPEIYILNSSQLTEKRRNARNEVAIEDGGKVNYVNRYIGNISTYHNLRRFPFDSQIFDIEISIPESSDNEITLEQDYERIWLSEKLNIEGWDFSQISMGIESRYLQQVQRDVSIATVKLNAQRNSTFYVYRMLLLLVAVVSMSWVIFWVPPGRFEFQFGLCATAMLTAIAFNLSIASSLPHVGYLTIMDQLVIWAVLMIFLAAVQALVTAQFYVKDHEPIALRIDYYARYLFPLAFFGGWAIIIWVL